MKRISGAMMVIAGAALLAAGPVRAQVEDLAPDVVVEAGLVPLLQATLRAADVPEDGLSPRTFPAGAAGRAFCLSGKAFMLLATAPLPARLREGCHAGPGEAVRAMNAPRGEIVRRKGSGKPGAGGGKAGKDNKAKPATATRKDARAPANRNGAAAYGLPQAGKARGAGAAAGERAALPKIVSLMLAREPLVAVQPQGAVGLRLDARSLFMALAAWLPQGGRIVRNPHAAWSDLGSALPQERIQILLPENARKEVRNFLRRACERGVLPYWEVQRVALDAETFKRQVAARCAVVRNDGAVRFLKGGDEAVVQALRRHWGALAFIGRGTWLRHRESLQTAPVEGDAPSRPLYLTVDRENTGRNPVARRVLRTLAEAVRRMGLLPPPPEQREVLLSLLSQMEQPKKETERAGDDGATRKGVVPGTARRMRAGPKTITVPQTPRARDVRTPAARPVPRVRGGVQLEPSPKAGRIINFGDLPPARNRRP